MYNINILCFMAKIPNSFFENVYKIGSEWILGQATQVARIPTKQREAAGFRCETGLEPVLQRFFGGRLATKVAGGVGHPIYSTAVSPRPFVMAASQHSQMIHTGENTRLPIMGVVRDARICTSRVQGW